MYLIRLDDASEYMNSDNWDRMEKILDKYSIKPIVGIIPDNQDKELVEKYHKNLKFWNAVDRWNNKNWEIALHGYSHVYTSNQGGINPVNSRSEFAGLSLCEQQKKIKYGMKIMHEHKLSPKIFFAPFHTFDMNTLKALEFESDIRIISDTIANDTYKLCNFYFIPQQCGHVRRLPFKVVTYCYHPNNMNENAFFLLEKFIKRNRQKFIDLNHLHLNDRNFGIFDKSLKNIYFLLRYLKNYKGK